MQPQRTISPCRNGYAGNKTITRGRHVQRQPHCATHTDMDPRTPVLDPAHPLSDAASLLAPPRATTGAALRAQLRDDKRCRDPADPVGRGLVQTASAPSIADRDLHPAGRPDTGQDMGDPAVRVSAPPSAMCGSRGSSPISSSPSAISAGVCFASTPPAWRSER